MAREGTIEIEGRIVEVLGDVIYRVELENGHRLVAHVSGKRRLVFEPLVLGTFVKVRLSPYDLSKGSIMAKDE